MSKHADEYWELTKNGKFLDLFYPDLKEHGSLRKLLQSQLNAIGSTLVAEGKDETISGQSVTWAFVSSDSRKVQVSVAAMERLFLLQMWERGVCLGSMKTESLQTIAQVADCWVVRQAAPQELKYRFPEVEFQPYTDVYYSGAEAYVEWKWAGLQRYVKEEKIFSVLEPIVKLAYADPILGKLMPFTSLNRLCFSQCTGFPFLVPCPIIIPTTRPDDVLNGVEPQYEIQDDSEKTILTGNAATIIDYLVKALPPNCGPACHGSARDLTG